MLKGTIKSLTLAAMLTTGAVAANAADYTIRATANSNENDEDYDGLVVFKNYVESASNGAIEVELFIGTQLCSKGAECLQGVARWFNRCVYFDIRRRGRYLPICASSGPALFDGG